MQGGQPAALCHTEAGVRRARPLASREGLASFQETVLKYSTGKPGEHLGSRSEENLLHFKVKFNFFNHSDNRTTVQKT